MGNLVHRDAGVKAARTVMLEMMALEALEGKCATLSERIFSKRTEMVGKLHKMGLGESTILRLPCLLVCIAECWTEAFRKASVNLPYYGMPSLHAGPDDTPPDDQSMPKEVHMWLVDYREHMHLQKRLERLRADFIDQPHPDLPHWRVEHKQHLDLKEQVKRLAAEVTNQLQVDAPLPERLQGLPHAADRKMTVRNRRGVTHDTFQSLRWPISHGDRISRKGLSTLYCLHVKHLMVQTATGVPQPHNTVGKRWPNPQSRSCASFSVSAFYTILTCLQKRWCCSWTIHEDLGWIKSH